jgi:hypothetical protein
MNGVITKFAKARPMIFKDLYKGMRLREIYRYDVHFYDCEIISIDTMGYHGGYESFYIIFKFRECSDRGIESYGVLNQAGERVIDYTCSDEDWNCIQ